MMGDFPPFVKNNLLVLTKLGNHSIIYITLYNVLLKGSGIDVEF